MGDATPSRSTPGGASGTGARFDARPVAVYRIVLGLSAVPMALKARSVLLAVTEPEVLAVPLVPWLPPVTPELVAALTATWALAALLLTVGAFGRWPAVALSLLGATTLGLEAQAYSNHLTLFVLMTALLAASDPTAVRSFDARGRAPRPTVAYWPVLLMRTQISVMYGFAAITKLNLEYLDGGVLLQHVPLLNRMVVAGVPRSVVTLISVAAVVIELFLAVGLWLPSTRRRAIAGGIVLHLGIVLGMPRLWFELLPFAAMSVGAYLLFVHHPLTGTPAEDHRDGNSASSVSSSAAR